MNENEKTGAHEGLKRNLKDRHIEMIALGCAIGTGLFYGSASTIQMVGPGVVLSYLIGGFFIYLVVRALAEMSVYHPVSGSFSTYAYQYWENLPVSLPAGITGFCM